MGLEHRANDALLVNGNTVNGGTADIAITTHGSDWYWVSILLSFRSLVHSINASRRFAQL